MRVASQSHAHPIWLQTVSNRPSLTFVPHSWIAQIDSCCGRGCEWPAFRYAATRTPHLLSQVRIILIEVHAIHMYGMKNGEMIDQLLNYLMDVHGFRLYRVHHNDGWPGARYHMKAGLRKLGFPGRPCCWLLHLMRPPAGTAATGAAGSISKSDWKKHRTRRRQSMKRRAAANAAATSQQSVAHRGHR